MSPDFDIIVIGFGPTGAVATCLLGQAGLRVLAIDRATEVYAKPRAIAIDHEILRLLQNIGVADAVLPHVAPFPASDHFGVDGQLIRRIDMVPPPYPQGYTPTMVFTQPPVEAAIRRHASAYPSVEVALGVSLVDLEQDAEKVTLRLEESGHLEERGTTRSVTAAYVIGCDGASSTVRQQLGIPLEDLVFDEPWLVVDLHVHPSGLAKIPVNAAQFCEPARPASYIVGPGNHRRWEIMLLPGEDPRSMEQPENVWRLLSRWLTPDDAELWRAASYRFHALVAETWRHARVFIAGDAAHQQPPFIGQGMCQGIRDAGNLAWKLIEVLEGRAAPTLLDTYGEERGSHVRMLTARIKAIGHAICERDVTAARARDARLLAEGGGVPPTFTRQEIVPPLETGLLARDGNSTNGTLFPQPWVIDAGHPRHMDDVAGAGWRLVLDARDSATTALHPDGVRIIRIIPPAAAPSPAAPSPGTLIEQDGVLTAWFEKHHCVGALIRPDHYVYGTIRTAADAAALLTTWRDSTRVLVNS